MSLQIGEMPDSNPGLLVLQSGALPLRKGEHIHSDGNDVNINCIILKSEKGKFYKYKIYRKLPNFALRDYKKMYFRGNPNHNQNIAGA